MARHWTGHGYEIVAVREHPENPAVYAETPEGFGIRLPFGAAGQAFLKASTPCAGESDVPRPEKPGGRAPLPHVESGFWSAAAG